MKDSGAVVPTSSPSLLRRSKKALFPALAAALLTLTLLHFKWRAGDREEPKPERRQDEVGRLPFMGYNTWNQFHCDINETVIFETAEQMVNLGLADLGYKYVNIDDCYSLKQRNSTGDIVADPERFPSGMRNLTDRIHALGLQAGIYSDSGWFTCQIYPGSYGNEERDARLFHNEWGFDLLKYDNCAVPFDNITRENIIGRYERMATALESLETPVLWSLCQWGRQQPWLWARNIGGHTWRTTDDISPAWWAITDIINKNAQITWANDFGGYGDMDILEVGNEGLNFEEQKTHFTAWALMKSPLLISTNLTTASDETLTILKNQEIIAIHQDPVVGTAVTPFRWGYNSDYSYDYLHPAEYWSSRSQNGTVIMVINTADNARDMFFNLTESPWNRAGRLYNVHDLWSHTDNGTALRNVSLPNVPAHGVVALLLTDAGDEPPDDSLFPCAVREWCMDQNGTRVDQFVPFGAPV